MIEKMPPNSPEDELAVIGSVLLDAQAVAFASDALAPGDFYQTQNRVIFETILGMTEDGSGVDMFTVHAELRRINKAEGIELDYLRGATHSVATAAHVKHHAEIVKDFSTLRQVMERCTEAIEDCWKHEKKPSEVLEKIERDVCAISNVGSRKIVKAGEVMGAMLEIFESLHTKKTEVSGLPTGFRSWDKLSSGLQPGNLVIIAARPGVGKTALALNIAHHVAVAKKIPVAFFSLEMSEQEILTRMLSAESGVSSFTLRNGMFDTGKWEAINRAAETLTDSNLFLDSSLSAATAGSIRSSCRRVAGQLARQGKPLGLVVVDYLQLMTGTGNKKNDTRNNEVAEISRSLKNLARELNIPVIALSQLNRSPEDRGRDGRPRLSDLRESGAIEQDADMVAFIYRPDMYKAEAKPEERNATKLIIAKQRNGSLGEIDMVFVPELTMFRELN